MSEKLYLKIGDVAKKFNVNTSLLRYWEQEFDFVKPKKNAKGTRYYAQNEIDNLSIVHYLVKEKGMTIQGVKDYLANRKSEKSLEQLNVISTLKKTKELLTGVRDILQKRK